MRIRDSRAKVPKAGKKKAEGRFWTIEDKLDEAELFSFIESLIEQNSELARKVECLESLGQLAEKTVIEAEKQAEGVREEAEREANARAESIHSKAKEAAKRIIAEARQAAETEGQEMLAAAQQQGQEMVKAVEEDARSKILAAEEQAQQMLKAAEEEGSRIVEEARKRAEEETERARSEADGLLVAGRGATEAQIREGLIKVFRDLGVGPNGSDETGESGAVGALAGTGARRSADRDGGNGKEAGPILYRGSVELLIRPPVTMREGLKLHKELTRNEQIKVLDVHGSADRGMIMELLVRADTPLIDILQEQPDIKNVGCVAPPARGAQEAPKIVVDLKH
jgi:F0F1-type ATP synthase membrane subunit b/b'